MWERDAYACHRLYALPVVSPRPSACYPGARLQLPVRAEAIMYLDIRKFNHVSSVAQAARRAESGIGQVLKQSPGFQG